MKTALVVGATGLVGSSLIQQLIDDVAFNSIVVLTRRSIEQNHPKIIEKIVDFDHIESWCNELMGDVLYSCLGTTLKKAGGKEQQFKIDYTYQYNCARHAALNGVKQYVLVSAAGADSKSSIFYSRMKGELEEAVKQLPFQYIAILQPGILDGNRSESRPMERLFIHLCKGFRYIPGLSQYRPIHADQVARAMIGVTKQNQQGVATYKLGQLFTLALESI